MEQIHATAISIDGAGVLLVGPSGSGKSDLALRLIDDGALLVADDRVDVGRSADDVFLSAPPRLRGLLEVRGVGIVKQPTIDCAGLALVIILTPADQMDRLPEPHTHIVAGRPMTALFLDPFELSAPAKVRLALKLVQGGVNSLSETDLLRGEGA